jgi:hypothetical protein
MKFLIFDHRNEQSVSLVLLAAGFFVWRTRMKTRPVRMRRRTLRRLSPRFHWSGPRRSAFDDEDESTDIETIGTGSDSGNENLDPI